MRSLRHTLIFSFALTLLCHSHSFAVEIITRYAWMLPKTVIDASILYTFQDCTGNKLKLKITPTLAPRTIPDPYVGRLKIVPQSLESALQDKNISIQTFAGSHILNSIGSSPTSQVAQVGGNILGGIAKLVGIVFGVSAAPFSTTSLTTSSPPPVDPQCWKDDWKDKPELIPADAPQAIANRIKDLKKKIGDLQDQLSNGTDEAAQKKINAAIQADQTIISTLQDQLTITVKTSIDPGVSPIDVNPDSDVFQYPVTPRAIQKNGQIARACPSKGQLKQPDKANWFLNLDDIFKDPRSHCAAIPTFEVNVYLDFPHAKGTMHDDDRKYESSVQEKYNQTEVQDGDLYRDVGYVPVLVWRGDKDTPPKVNDDGSAGGSLLLVSPQTMPFGQYGVAQTLPLTAKVFESLIWQITFLENGEITSSSFTSKATAVTATSFFGSAASAANSIATEQRSASSASSANAQATALQGQADLIYQTQRLALCQTSPASCPGK
jgi:cell division septum initiation protein DivIVA